LSFDFLVIKNASNVSLKFKDLETNDVNIRFGNVNVWNLKVIFLI